MKKLSVKALSLIAAISLPLPLFAQSVVPCDQTTRLSASASGAQTYTANGRQELGGSGDDRFGYEIWTARGSGNKLIWYGPNQGGGMAFRAEWNNPDDYLGRMGFFWGTNGKKWDQYKNIYADFNYTKSGNGTGGSYSYIGIYGWTLNPQMEWYIIDDWFGSGQLGPATICGNSCSPLGTVTVDGGTYNIYTNTRPAGSGSILNDGKAFPQIFSIRQGMSSSRRQCGTYSITEHFKAWSNISSIKNLIGNNTYEAKFLAEAGGGSGWFELSYLKMTREDQPRGQVPSGNFTLTTSASPTSGGDVGKSPSSASYAPGTSVTLTATPKSGYTFDRWSGDATGTTATVSVTMNANKNVTAIFTPTSGNTTNLIKNGTFTSTSDWTLNKWQNSAGTFGVSGGAANITGITRPSGEGAANHSLQLVQNGIPLIEGQKYRLTFEAKAASARTIDLVMQMEDDPWTTYYSKDAVSLTSSWQEFSYDFEMTDATDENGRIAFNFGGATPDVNIRNVKLVYSTGPTGITLRNRAAAVKSGLRASVLSNSAVSAAFTASNSGEATLKLYNLKGNVVSAAKLQTTAGASYSHTFNTGKIPNGFYLIGLNNNGKVEQAKVVVPR